MNLVHAMNVVATYSGLTKFGIVLIVTIQKKSKTEKLSITGFCTSGEEAFLDETWIPPVWN